MKKLIYILFLGASINCFAQNTEVKFVEYFGAEIPTIYYDYLVEMCTLYRVPIVYAARLIQWESKWNPKCVTINPDGTKDYGLMKHNEKSIPDFTWRYNKGKKYDPLNWKDNMRIGIQHLATLRKVTGSWFSTICAYNMGLTGYNKWREEKRTLPLPTIKELEFVFG